MCQWKVGSGCSFRVAVRVLPMHDCRVFAGITFQWTKTQATSMMQLKPVLSESVIKAGAGGQAGKIETSNMSKEHAYVQVAKTE